MKSGGSERANLRNSSHEISKNQAFASDIAARVEAIDWTQA